MDKVENVNCPMLRDNIDIAYCIELQMIVGNEVLPTDKEKHLSDADYKRCRQCKVRKMLDEE